MCTVMHPFQVIHFLEIQISVYQPTFLLATREFHNKAASWRRKLRSPLAPVNSICVAISDYTTGLQKTQTFLEYRPTANATAKLGTQEVVSKPFEKLTALYKFRFWNYACLDPQQKNCCWEVGMFEDAYR